ncbi:hypothetical protein HXA31_06410 [Salipaludibacillus agaradhaerens]|uniref:Uncharacterized protein n=1 Tax=Salipaludibacillus agaradhaerens TaxID=76935 RepID=A0A9Q4B178_SALAG|nr:hypothetical protein [Salipaludibacillus agaradhaerens]MCR6096449.1 hypothetical protein [Salipaludibacillus agaradhaerens]MCR6113992.1 hypothetical protein [Salipaludibacillus agaradhaerens]
MTLQPKNMLNRLLKSLLVSFVCIIVLSIIINLTAIKLPILTEASYERYLILFLYLIVMIFYVSLLFDQLYLSQKAKGISLFFYLFIMTGSLQLLESLVAQINVQPKAIVDVIVYTLVITSFTVLIFRYYGKGAESYTKRIKNYFSHQHISKWLLKCIYAIFLLFIAHYLINSMLTPFIEPYYNGRYTNILKMSHHAGDVKYVSMLTHALVMVVGFQPLFALWKGSKTSLLFWFGFPLFIILAFQPFIFNVHWPLGFRFPLFIEETLIMYIHAIILVHLFYVPDETHKEEELVKSKLSLSNW